MPKKKDTPAPAPTEGHNSTPVPPELFNRHLAMIEGAEEACKKASLRRLQLRKQARADGIILGEFDRMRRLAALPRAEQITNMLAARSYLIFLRSPLGAQMSMEFDAIDPFSETEDDATMRIDADAEADGYRAGLAGVLWEDGNPHSADTPAGWAWLKGYRDGQTLKVEALGDDANTGA